MLERLSLQRVSIIILFALIFAMAVRIPVDTDTWWHLRAGERTLADRAVLTFDPFSHTRAGADWINHSWGAQLILVLFYRLGGDAGLAIYTALLAALGMGFVYLACAGNVYLRAFALVMGAAAAAIFWSARPQMISFLLSTVVAYLLHRYKYRKDARALWAIPPVMLLWVNLHGGFAIGFILMAGVIAGEIAGRLFDPDAPDVMSRRDIGRLGLAALASMAAICINPYGPVMLAYPLRTVSTGALQDFIQEWASPNFHERQTWPFILILLGVLGFAGLSRKKLGWTDLALVAGTTYMALTAGRNIAVFAVVATPVLTRHLDAWLEDRGWRLRPAARARGAMKYVNLLLLVVVVLGAGLKVVGVLLPAAVAEAQAEYLPVRVSAWLNAQGDALPGQMFNSYNWGGYLMFAVPEHPVFVDGRTVLYDDAFLRAYMDAWTARPGWQDLLEAYDIGFVVVEANAPLALVLRRSAGWAVRYEDEQAVVFVLA